jgi:hypothetical protein
MKFIKLVVLALVLFVLPSWAFYQLPDISKGEIRDRAERKLLFKYERAVTKTPDGSTVKRTFSDPQGEVVAVETCFYKGDKLVRMEIDQKQIKGKGFFEVVGDKVNFQWEQNEKKKSDSEKLESNMISTDEVVPFLHKNWKAIMSGETVNIRFPVIDRAETVGFKFFKDSESEGTVTIKMKPSSIVIAALVNPLLFRFEKGGESRLLEVNGRVTPKIKEGEKWKDLDALFVLNY